MFPQTKKRTIWYINTQKKLSLSRKKIGAVQAKIIAEELAPNTTLKLLDLSWNDIGGYGTAVIASALRTNKSLRALYLGNNGMGDDGAAAIATALRTNTSLKTLDLTGNRIGDLGMASIAQTLTLNNSLENLSLSENVVRTAGLTLLVDALKVNTGLTNLWLYGSINDDGATILTNVNTLVALHLDDKNIGNVGAQAILDGPKVYNAKQIRAAIQWLSVTNRPRTRSDVSPIFGGAPSLQNQSGSTIAALQHQPPLETKPEPLVFANENQDAAPTDPISPTPATAASSVTRPGNQLAWLHCLSDDHEGPVGLPKQQGELEVEIQRPTVQNACLATADKNQWRPEDISLDWQWVDEVDP
jgi:Leucine Rich repeat